MELLAILRSADRASVRRMEQAGLLEGTRLQPGHGRSKKEGDQVDQGNSGRGSHFRLHQCKRGTVPRSR